MILASSSVVRKQMLSDAGIPFEVCESNADETPNKTKSLKDQMTEIAMRKAMAVFEKTRDRGRRLIVAADQNIMFDGELYGKPKNVDEARKMLSKMRGSDEIYSYTGNALLLADHDKILEIVNLTDTARLVMDDLSDAEIEKFLKNGAWNTVCGAANVNNALFVRLAEGRLSTAKGMTLEYLTEMMKSL